MKYLIIFLFALLPFFAQAQLLRAYGVVEIGSTFPTSSVSGAKFAYRTTDSSFYRWIHTNVWVKVVEPSITPDTLYLTQISGTTAIVNGDTINLTPYVLKTDTTSILAPYIKLAGWGLLKSTNTLTVDSSKVASRYYVSTSPTTIANNYIATSNGTNLVARNLFDNNTYVGILNSKPVIFGSQSVAGLPVGVDGYWLDVSNYKWPARYNSTAGAWIYPLQSLLTGGLGTAGRVLYTDANGRATDNANLLFTGTRFQTAGSIRIGNSSHTDTVSIGKVTDTNSKVLRINNPGSSGAFNSGLVFRGGSGGTLASVNTFRIAVRSTTRPGAVYIGDVTEASSANSEATTSLGILNKVTSLGTFDAALNLHPATGLGGYSLAAGKQYGIFIGGETSTIFTNFSVANTFGIFLGYQYQPTAAGYAGSFVVSAKNDGGTNRELARFQGKDGNLCLGCTNATYNIYTDNTGAFGIPSGTVVQRPTFSTSHPYLRFNTDSTQLEYAEAGGTIRQIASRDYARSLVSGLPTTNIYTANGSLTSNRTLTGGSFNLTFNAKTKIGLDSSFVHDPAQDTTYLRGNTRIQSGNLTIEKASGTPYLNIIGKSTSNQEAGIYMESRGNFGSIFEINGQSVSQLVFYNYQRAASAGNNFTIGENNGRTGATAYGDFIVVDSTSNSSTANRRFRFDSRGEAQFYNYGTEATTAATLGETESGYVASFATGGKIVSRLADNLPNFYNNNDTIGTGRIATVLDSVRFKNGSTEILKLKSNGLVTLGTYTSSAPFTAPALGIDAGELFSAPAPDGKLIQRKIRETANVKDADLEITDFMLELAQDVHVWAYCSGAASDSVVIDLPTPSLDYIGQKVSVYGDGRNATPGRDVYVRCVGAKLWHGNASPTGETYYQVTSLGGINSKTAEFVCVQNPDDSLYYWQLIQHQ